jgi:DNA topoisomerase VI subunit B
MATKCTNNNGVLNRTAFSTSRDLEFFSEKELAMQIGHARSCWPVALLKELADNGLDAAEQAGVAPRVEVTVEKDALMVEDNGPGLPAHVLERSLHYSVRVSDKAHYVSPTRGQLGNALKCVWAAPFVVDGSRGDVEVITGGLRHRVEVTLDHIEQKPRLEHTAEPADGKTGTSLRMRWPGIASLRAAPAPGFYNARRLLRAYAAFNPHAAFILRDVEGKLDLAGTDPSWTKWLPNNPTSPHWYTAEHLRGLIAAYLAEERQGSRPKTVREFVAEFAGLSGSRKPKAVLAAAGLSGTWLRDLVRDGKVDAEAVKRLLTVMRDASRPVRPKALGVLGEEHLTRCLVRDHGAAPDSIRYRRVLDEADGLPFVAEVAFAVKRAREGTRVMVPGLNWSPALIWPSQELLPVLAEMRLDSMDPVVLLVHLACPRVGAEDRGKARLVLPDAIRDALGKALSQAAQPWRDAKRQADRRGRVAERDLERLRKANRARKVSIKRAAYQVMPEAYRHTSDGGRLPANARQIMYAARPRVQELTDGRCWSKSSYFTQHLLPDYVEAHPDETVDWDVVFDARGRLVEPHTGRRIDLGTLQVREYIDTWHGGLAGPPPVTISHAYPTAGPANRFGFALFVEKEGFGPLLEQAQVAARYDLAIMSTKGMSVTAARQLVERLSEEGVTVLVLRDFDKSGFSIVYTIQTNTRRYRFTTRPRVVDLGLRLADVRALGLEAEDVEYRSGKDPRLKLRESGATDEECDFLVQRQTTSGWVGRRVELNAMTSPQFLAFLEGKLAEAGVRKVVPGEDVLPDAYRRAWRLARAQEELNRVLRELETEQVTVPDGLADALTESTRDSVRSWDEALWEMVKDNLRAGAPHAEDSPSQCPPSGE